MLGRKTYTREEIDHADESVRAQLTAYRRLADAVGDSGDAEAQAALAALEPTLFNGLALALDRRFVHRLRSVTGKDGTPLNELELVAASLLDNGGSLQTNSVIKYRADGAVLRLAPGERIELSSDGFEALADGILEELRAKYLEG
jgi:hypothetical protein